MMALPAGRCVALAPRAGIIARRAARGVAVTIGAGLPW